MIIDLGSRLSEQIERKVDINHTLGGLVVGLDKYIKSLGMPKDQESIVLKLFKDIYQQPSDLSNLVEVTTLIILLFEDRARKSLK